MIATPESTSSTATGTQTIDSPTAPAVARPRFAAIATTSAIAAAVTFIALWLTLRKGLAVGPDAWTYWGASIALLQGEGYVNAHGLPVQSWPPLYATWLAAVQSVFGVSIASVRLADCITTAVAAAAFTAWALRRGASATSRRWPVAVFVAALLVLQVRGLSPNALVLALLGMLLLALDRLGAVRRVGPRLLLTTLASLLAAGMCLSHHIALALVLSVPLIVLHPRRRAPLPTRLVTAAVIVGIALATWWSVRIALGQSDSHGFLNSNRELFDTLWYATRQVGRLLAPFPIGIITFALLLGALARRTRQPDAVLFTGCALCGVLGMFLLVHVADPPGARFIGFAPLVVGAFGVALATRIESPKRRWLVLALLVLPPSVRGALHLHGREQPTNVTPDGGVVFVPPEAALDWQRPAGTELPDDRITVTAPLFTWERERLDRGEGRR